MSKAAPARARCVRVCSRLNEFGDIWPSIAAPLPGAHVFQTREFLDIWLQTIGAARKVRPCFVSITDDAGLHILAPLGIEVRRGARVLTFLDGGVSDYNAPIVLAAPHGVPPAQTLWQDIIAAVAPVDTVVLEKMPFILGDRSNPLCAGSGKAAPPSAYALQLTGDWRSYEKSRLHRPKDSRRKRRRLAEAGPVRLLIAETRSQVGRLYAAFVQQKTRRYIEKNGADGFDRPGYRRYFEMMTERLHPGHVHLSALEVNGELLATHWGLVYGRRFYCLMLAYADSPLAQYSPARLLVEDLIAWCYAHGLETFDFGVGDAAWKTLMGADAAPLSHSVLPLTAFGWAYDSAARLKRHMLAPHPKPLPVSRDGVSA
ncbi:MAG TPA: GNAT family N-acetyltransferase [Vitreimonas sp.]|uniref:GNAT family N-acetyltransferase n=1 Tax=Vitreimonas sp. TaxID=3069702 RepID=UPI002D58A73D|nr:GNAT family N-acetyltransferase [Vitreimonas sp.]HYD86075.1 GNAT family N-acetyltransferase [Vitreimonas sp.]